MKLGKKIFPYPVLNNAQNVSGFNESNNYELKYDGPILTEDEFILNNVCISLDNSDIEQFLADGRAKAVLIVECSTTVFRERYYIDLEPRNIVIPVSDLNDKVEISSFIFATQDIPHFNSNGFIEDFAEYDFMIEKYDILAVDDGFTSKVLFNEDNDKKLSSIFSIIKSSKDNLEHMNVTSNNEQIIIEMPKDYFGYHDNMKYNDVFQNIFFGLIAIPALAKSIDEVKYCIDDVYNGDIEEVINEKTWFASVKARFKDVYGIEWTRDELIDTDSYEIAQKLLNCGSTKALEDIYKFAYNTRMSGDEDE